jgi:CheY-like chemotaxis protein
VVVADDEALVRAVAKATLEEAGLRVLTARDGAEAVRLVRERGKGIAAVVLDLTMPGMGGEEAFEEIRALRPELPVILSTGYSEQEALSRFADRKPAGLIEKPYDPAALAAAVARALGG